MTTGAEVIISSLEEHGVKTIFGYPGGCIMPLYDALVDASLRHILCRHEQAAALAADGYARASGQLGVCVATSGPGATNLVTGVANAYMDSVPMLVLTGQVPATLLGTDAFQETDILGMTLGIVKHSYLVSTADQLPGIIKEAITLATEGRAGPVWIDLPKDTLLQTIKQQPAANTVKAALPTAPFSPAASVTTTASATLQATPDPAHQLQTGQQEQIRFARQLIAASKKPLVYSGGGVMAANALTAYQHFVCQLGLPQVQTLKGLGNGGDEQILDLGMLGMHGSQAANQAVTECDLLIAIGVRFDDRATGKPDGFAPKAKIIHLDADPSEFHKLKRADCCLSGDLKTLLADIIPDQQGMDISPWQRYCQQLKVLKSFHPTPDPDALAPIDGPEFLSLLSQLKPRDCTISCDVGQHQMWVAQYMTFAEPRKHLSSGGLGTMGFGLPAAIGAQLANPQETVVNVTGDGSFMINIQELATIRRYQLPVKIIILDNQRLGMVRQQQELFYDERYSEIDLSDNPDFVAIGKAFGIHGLRVDARHQMRRSIETLFCYPKSMLLHVSIRAETNVWPIIKPGASNHEMIDPFTSDENRATCGPTYAANHE